MNKIAEGINELYDLYKISNTQYFVKMQKLFVFVAKEYWGKDIDNYLDANNKLKEYNAIYQAMESASVENRDFRAFQGMWGYANEIKHQEENDPFETNYAFLCAQTFNSITGQLLDETSVGNLIDCARLTNQENTVVNKVQDALEKALLKKAEEDALITYQSVQKEKQRRIDEKLCPICGAKLVLRHRHKDNAPFWGCTNYFDSGCRGIIDYVEPEKQKEGDNISYQNQAIWFVERERKENARVYYIQSLGLTSKIIKALSSDEDLRQNYKRYSHWRFDNVPSRKKQISQGIKFVSSLAYKILTRGRVTMISPWSEEKIEGVFKKEPSLRPEGMSNYKRFENEVRHWMDSKSEKHFYNVIVPRIMGENYYEYLLPQIDLASLICCDAELGNQRVDFAINDGNCKLAVEIDDVGHSNHTEYDNRRDEILTDAGFTVIRIPNSEISKGVGENLDELEEYLQDFNFKDGKANPDKVQIASKIIHQIQIVVMHGIMQGLYNTDDTIRIDMATNIFSAMEEGDLLRVLFQDLNNFGNNLAVLYGIEPRFNLQGYCGHEKNSIKEISYDLSKEPSMNRTIVADFIYQCDFINNLPLYSDLSAKNCSEELIEYFLYYIFRKERLREGQYQAIENTLLKKDSVVLLPTGAGKSIAFQLASILTPGISFVISPLVSLMEDQVDNLLQYGVDRVAALTGALSKEAKKELANSIISGDVVLSYISPERLQIESFRETIKMTVSDIPIPIFVIDEAHCLSEWGHDFRTAYLNLGRIIRTQCQFDGKAPTIIALTGTASDNVLLDVRTQLGIWGDDSIITPLTFDRKELHYSVAQCYSEQKMNTLLETLQVLPKRYNEKDTDFFSLNKENSYCGIVFCPHVNALYGVNTIYNELRSRGYQCGIYAGSKPKKWPDNRNWDVLKRENAQKFKNNEYNMLVATTAYGMGIDKDNIRYVVHYNLPKSIEAYYQETGRAGRNRMDAECILIASLEGGGDDLDRMTWFHNNAFKGKDVELNNIESVLQQLHLQTNPGQFVTLTNLKLTSDNGSDNDSKGVDTEKAIYRLLLIGIIEDYTKLRTYEYKIKVAKFSKETIRKAYLDFVTQYHKGRATVEAERFDKIKSKEIDDIIISAAGLLIEFLYDNIERSRREAMYSMRQLALDASKSPNQDKLVRSEIINYLKTSEQELINEVLESEVGGITEIIEIFTNKMNNEKQRKGIKGQINRALESRPDYPGLLFGRAFINVIEKSEDKLEGAIHDLRLGIEYSRTRYSIDEQLIITFFNWLFHEIWNSIGETGILEIASGIEELFSSEVPLDLISPYIEEEELLLPFAYKYLNEYTGKIMEMIG